MNVFAKSSSEKLIHEIKSVVADAEALLQATKGQAGAEVAELHASMTGRLAAAKNHLLSVEAAVVDKARRTAKHADEFLHDNPWQSTFVAAGVGLVIGYLLRPGRE